MWTEDDESREELPTALRPYVQALRTPVAVRPAWRESVLREIAAAHAPRVDRRARRWSVAPQTAIAAGFACMVLGAGAAWLVARRATPAPITASAAGADTAATLVRFALLAPGAGRVALVGDFNRWDPAATPLRASRDGRTWEVRVPLSPGRHVYAFVVDGGIRIDPAAPRTADDDFGTPSSVVLVGGSS